MNTFTTRLRDSGAVTRLRLTAAVIDAAANSDNDLDALYKISRALPMVRELYRDLYKLVDEERNDDI